MESTPHIAVVDDHRDIRELVGRYLAQHGYRVSAAESAAALRRLLERSAPDLVVLDVMMPGEDGLSVCRYLRATTDLPIILLTAAGGGDRPHRRPGDRRRRLRDQAVQSARAAGAHQGGAAARPQPAAAERGAPRHGSCASTAGCSMSAGAS